MDFKKLPLSLLDPNTGQIPGLPPNPRAWTDLEMKRLAKSMKDTPELVEARGCIVVPYEGRYVVLGGNMRLAAAKHLKWTEIMCGDSTRLEEVKKLMGGAVADLWLTDPPYNVGYGMEDSVMMSKRKHRTDGLIVLNDRQEDGQFREFLKNAYHAALEVMKPGAAFYIWHADNEGYNFRAAVRETKGMKLSECLIWVKDSLCLGRNDYHWRHEPCLYGWKEGESHHWYSDRKQTTCIEMPRPRKSEEHPTMKPVALFGYQMQNSTKNGDVVLDSFGGSGTTLIAAEQCKRRAMLMELDPHYCDVIIARWEKFTGREATKIE